MRIGQKLILGFLSVVVLTAILGIVNIVSIRNIGITTEAHHILHQPLVADILHIRIDLEEIVRTTEEYDSDWMTKEEATEIIEEKKEDIETHLEHLSTATDLFTLEEVEGIKDSIKINQPVINRFGLVGKIKEVMSEYSTVQLLTDPANAVSARIAESRQFGIVRYTAEKGMIFDNLPADAGINKGDLIISSGLGGIYPSGLSIAVVDSVLAAKGEIKKSIWLKSNVDFF